MEGVSRFYKILILINSLVLAIWDVNKYHVVPIN